MKRILLPGLGLFLLACSLLSPQPNIPTPAAAATPSQTAPAASITPAAAPVQPPPPPTVLPVRRAYALGISLEGGSYASRAFTNLFKIDARVWAPGTMTPGPVDEHGMPSSDFDLFALDGAFLQKTAGFHGTYRLYFNGQAELSAQGGTLQNQVYNSAQNLTQVDFHISDPYPTVRFDFRNTRRSADSPLHSGVTGLKLMRPLSPGSTESYPPETVFTTEFLDLHRRAEVLRMMDFTATNGNIQREWADRSTPADLTYYGETPGYWWQGKGAPWEDAILLANTLDTDLWINIPVYASDDYISRLAGLISDTLEPERRIYIEYSNELWNFGMPQWNQIQELVDEDLASNPQTSINYDGLVRSGGKTEYGIGVPRYWARRILQISDLFRSRFGDDAMLTRVRPVFATQAAWQHWISTGLLFLDSYYNNAAGSTYVSQPRPVNTYLWGGGGSGYVHGFPEGLASNPAATLEDIFAGYEQAWPAHYATMAADVYWLSAFGLKRAAYEGGTGLDDFASDESAVQRAQLDERMQAVYRRAIETFFAAGGDLYLTFQGVNPPHGLLPYDVIPGSQPHPKLDAFDALLAVETRPAPTVGYPIPGRIPAGRYHIREDGWSSGENDGPAHLEGAYSWTSYTLNASQPGTYQLTLEISNSSNGQATLWLDGSALQTNLVCPANGETAPIAMNLTPGVHAIRVQAATGGFDLRALRISAP